MSATNDDGERNGDIPFAEAELLMESISDFPAQRHSFANVALRPSFKPFSLPPSEDTKPLLSHQMQDLKSLGFPRGLANAMNSNNAQFPLRVWIIDNSGSMKKDDGSRIVALPPKMSSSKNVNAASTRIGTNQYKVVQCTRWAEMQETVDFHSQMASMVNAPTLFRFLNKPFLTPHVPREFYVHNGSDDDNNDEDDNNKKMPAKENNSENNNNNKNVKDQKPSATIAATIESSAKQACSWIAQVEPKGCTPLSKRVLEIRSNLVQLQDELLERGGCRIAVILATDGLPTDREGTCNRHTKHEFISALKSLEGLPVWVVIRLCTQSQDVVEFYNDLDLQLELEIEVMDDFFQEAKELYKYNKWINYALPLHRAREMGFHHRLFDLLDERKLTLDEVRQYFELLFGKDKMQSVPDAHVNLKGFLSAMERIIQSEPKQFNPITKKDAPWVDLKRISKMYRDKNCNVM